MIKDAETFKKDDEDNLEKIQRKNSIEELCNQFIVMLSSDGILEKITQEEKE